MDRTVIVLTPDEWNKRVSIGEGMQMAYNHSHYAVTNVSNVTTVLWNIERAIREGESMEEIYKEIDHAKRIAKNTTSEIRESQKYLSGVATVIKYKLQEESRRRSACSAGLAELI